MRRIRSFLSVVGCIAIAASSTGCCCFGGRSKQAAPPPPVSGASVHVAPVSSSIERIAIMPFRAPTELIGASISDLFVTELMRVQRYELLERGQLSSVLSEAEVALSGISDARAVELGNMLGADGVVVGSVDEYGMIARRGKNYAVVGMSVRLIDCESGSVMWSASLADASREAGCPLSQQARTVVRGVVFALQRQWHVQRKVPRVRSPSSRADPNEAVPRVAGTGVSAAPEPPARPTGYSVSDLGLREATLGWPDPGVPGLQYRIERAPAPQGPFAPVGRLAASRRSYTDRGLSDSTTYYYRIVAVAPSGLESEAGPVAESMTAPPPSPVRNVTAQSGLARSVLVTWSENEDEGLASYRVYRAEGDSREFALAGEVPVRNGCRFLDGGRTPGRLADDAVYTYRVRAVNSVGAEGADSQTAEARTKPVPVAPTDCSATVGRPRGIVLNWSPNPEADIAAYVVEGRESSRGRFRQIARVEASAGLEYEHRSLPAGCEFVYRIKAVDADGLDGAWSDEVAGSTKPLPSAPSQLQCAWDGDVARLTWTASAESDVERYNVKQLGFFGAKALCAADGTSADLAAGTIGKRIKVVVTAVDVDGLESEPSEVIEISSQSMGT